MVELSSSFPIGDLQHEVDSIPENSEDTLVILKTGVGGITLHEANGMCALYSSQAIVSASQWTSQWIMDWQGLFQSWHCVPGAMGVLCQ